MAQKRPFEVITWDGGKIGAPGVYDMPIEAYHGDCCVGPSISSSGIRTIENQSPKHYFANSYLNPKRLPAPPKAAFDIGRAAHTLLLGESGFREKFVIRPERFKDWRTDAAKLWREQQIMDGKSVLTSDDIEDIKGMADSLADDELIASGLLNGEIERSMIWQDQETGIWLKARPDALPINADAIADLKTTDCADAVSVRRSILNYGYHIQLALAGLGMKATTGREPGEDDYILAFVEKKSPYCVNVKPIDIGLIDKGKVQIRSALRTFADCLSSGKWPGYPDNGAKAYAPKWFLDQMDARVKSGELPKDIAA